MYAQLGDIVFDPLAGFNDYSESDDATIAQYPLLQAKPNPVTTAPNLRELTIGIRLHQAFIIVKNARLQLRAYKDNGTPVTLTWGNGDVEGQFLIKSISTTLEYQDGLGNVISANLSIGLLEYPAGSTLQVKQASAYKTAFGITSNATPVINITPNKVPAKSQFVQIFTKALKYAEIINSLSYGGTLPALNGSLASNIANATTNLTVLQQFFSANQDDLGLPDSVGTDIGNAIADLNTLSGLDPITDALDFQTANGSLQTHIAALNSDSFISMAQILTRVDNLSFN